ncbi:hypothetical protein ACFLTE_10625 [Bacteroidota bacterium]
MKTTFNIYSSAGFIGFCFIVNYNEQLVQGGLTIYETFEIEGNTMMYPQSTKYNLYPINKSELDIIRDLIQSLIPTFRTNDLTYSAIDNKGQKQTI